MTKAFIFNKMTYEEQLKYIEDNGVEISQDRRAIIYNGLLHIIYNGGIVNSRDTVHLTRDDYEQLVKISEIEKERLSQETMREQINE